LTNFFSSPALIVVDEETLDERSHRVKKSFTLPWWFKIVAYVMSFTFMVVSAFFTVVKGISLGDTTTGKWLTSFVVSAASSCLITQPLQVCSKFTFLV
jgi:hypothetical protein